MGYQVSAADDIGNTFDLFGDSLSELAEQCKERNANPTGPVRLDNGEIVGWINGDGTWRYV